MCHRLSGLSDRAVRNLLVCIAAHEVELRKAQDGAVTSKQRSAIRLTLYSLLPEQADQHLAEWWDTVVSQSRIIVELEADPADACMTYEAIENAKPADIIHLGNSAIRERAYAMGQLLNPPKRAAA